MGGVQESGGTIEIKKWVVCMHSKRFGMSHGEIFPHGCSRYIKQYSMGIHKL